MNLGRLVTDHEEVLGGSVVLGGSMVLGGSIVLGGSCVECSVLDARLFDKVVRALDGCQHALDGEEGGQVGGVR